MMRPDRDRLALAGILVALLFSGALSWLAIIIIVLSGRLVAGLVAIVGSAAVALALWWLHTEGDREARAWQRRWRELGRVELPRAHAQWRRGRR